MVGFKRVGDKLDVKMEAILELGVWTAGDVYKIRIEGTQFPARYVNMSNIM